MRSVQSTLFALLAASTAASAETTLNLTRGVSPISHDVYDLHMTIFWICVVIGIVVFGAMFYAIIYHRKSRGAIPADFHSHTWLEIGWTIVPVLILILMAIPATKVLLNMNNNEQEDITIKVTGYQWKWHYEYIEDGVSFFSNLSTPPDQMKNLAPKGKDYLREVDKPLVVPIHKKIRFLITSNDVNHAWWVPDFGIKRDAIAGLINEAWTRIDKPGVYRGQCAELCGINHAYMPIVVIAMSEQGYKDWVAQQKGQATQGEAETNKQWTMQELMEKGEKVYGTICAACHQPTGMGLPPTFPALKGSKIATGPAGDHVNIVFNGKSGTAMQAFKGQLNDVELAAVITYERNAWGNNTGTMVQPIQIKTLREGKSMDEALAAKPGAAPAAGAAKPTPPTTTPSTTTGQPAPAAPAQSTTAQPAAPAQAAAPTAAAPASTAAPAPAAPAQGTTAQPAAPAQAAAPTAAAPASTAAPAQAAPAQSTTAQPAAPAQAAAPTAAAPASTAAPAPAAPAQSTTAQPAASAQAAAPTAAAPSADDLKQAMERGEKVYTGTCAVCHQATGAGMPPTFPALKDSKIAKGPVGDHINIVMNGKQGTAMQAFKDQFNDQQLADVITYERNAWGNNTGTLVKPDEIKAARQQGQK